MEGLAEQSMRDSHSSQNADRNSSSADHRDHCRVCRGRSALHQDTEHKYPLLIVDLVSVRCRLVNNTGGIVIEATTPMGDTEVRMISHEIGTSDNWSILQGQHKKVRCTTKPLTVINTTIA